MLNCHHCLACMLGLALSLGVPAFSHQPIEQPAPGHLDVSIEPQLKGSLSFDFFEAYDASHSLKKVYFSQFEPNYNGAGLGFSSLVEMGLLPGWSLGLNINFPQWVIDIINGYTGYDIDIGLQSNLRLVQADWFTLNLHAKIKAMSLFYFGDSPASNLINAYVMLGSGYRLQEWEGGSFSAYADLKFQTTWLNTLHTDPFSYVCALTSSSSDELQGVDVSFFDTYRLALGVGLDLELDGFWISLGWNFPLVLFGLGEKFEYVLNPYNQLPGIGVQVVSSGLFSPWLRWRAKSCPLLMDFTIQRADWPKNRLRTCNDEMGIPSFSGFYLSVYKAWAVAYSFLNTGNQGFLA